MGYSVTVLRSAEKFLDSLEPKLAAKAFREMGLLAHFGPQLAFPHAKKIVGTTNLHELRVKQGNNICRLFYFFLGNNIYVVISGYIKKTDKTDPDQINRAIRLMNEYLEENDEQG